MKQTKRIKYIHQDQYVLEVEVTLLETGDAWAPYLSIEDAYRLDDARDALHRGDIDAAARYGKLFTMTPV